MSEQALQKRESQQAIEALSVAELSGHVSLIRQAMASVMRPGEHYGSIPGCGEKKTLLLPGAQTLSLMFRMSPRYAETEKDLGRGHREYKVNCSLSNARGDFVGEGVGSCSTMESKFRYRSENTGREVPGDYWKTRDSNLLGGPQFKPKKVAGKWTIAEQVEYENPADYYNTCLKMAKKRAFVDAILTRTAASDIFTQDVEEMAENETALSGHAHEQQQEPPQAAPTPQKATSAPKNGVPWRDLKLHFGKNSDTPLGRLSSQQLQWYMEKWEPKEYPEGSGRYSEKDLTLRKALNQAQSELKADENIEAESGLAPA